LLKKSNDSAKNQRPTSLVKELTNKQLISITVILLTIISFYSLFTIKVEGDQLEKKVDESIHYLADIISIPLWTIQEQVIQLIVDSLFQDPDVLFIKITDNSRNEDIVILQKNSSFPRIIAHRDIYYNNRVIGHIEYAYSKKSYVTRILNLIVFELLVSIFVFFSLLIMNKKIIKSYIKSPIDQLSQILNSYNEEGSNDNTSTIKFEEFQPLLVVFNNMKKDIFRDTVERKKNHEALQKSEENLKTILNSIGDGVIATDIHCNVIRMNHVAERLTGYSSEYANGKSLKEIFQIENPLTGEILINPVEKILSGERSMKQLTSTMLISRDSSTYQISNSASLILNKEEETMGVVMVFSDITEELVLQEQLNHKNRMDAIGQLAGGMAHDFNNMLGGIMNSAQLLKSPKRNLDGKGIKYVDLILQASERAADLTAKLLAFGRKGKIASTVVDLHKIIDETASILMSTIDKKIKISVDKQAQAFKVVGDGSVLQNAFLNLCINSSQALPDGGEIHIISRNITLNRTYCNTSTFDIEPGEYCEIEILDSGLGIATENLTKIFEPFYTTKELGKGTGLGLSAVYGTVQDHHGAITVYSEVGSGSSFHIKLPCSYERIETGKKREQILSGSGTILIVDDEELIRITGRDMLITMGYKVLLAENGEEAVDVFTNNYSEIDLVLMDMIMPLMNGREAFEKMRNIDNKCKVIISSGFTKDENLEELRQEGLAGFIRKPYRDYELSKLLDNVLNTQS